MNRKLRISPLNMSKTNQKRKFHGDTNTIRFRKRRKTTSIEIRDQIIKNPVYGNINYQLKELYLDCMGTVNLDKYF